MSGQDGVYHPRKILGDGDEWYRSLEKLFSMVNMGNTITHVNPIPHRYAESSSSILHLSNQTMISAYNLTVAVCGRTSFLLYRIYFCEFLLRATLAELYLSGLPAMCTFVHTPE